MTKYTKTKPNAGGRWASDAVTALRARSGRFEPTDSSARSQSAQLPDNWRDRLPDPPSYYRERVAKLGKRSGNWTVGLCPFHADHNPSFGVKLASARGQWECFAGCGGGDLLTFHMRVTGYGFSNAVRDLLRFLP